MPDEMPVSEMGGLAMYIDADFVAKFEVKVLKKKKISKKPEIHPVVVIFFFLAVLPKPYQLGCRYSTNFGRLGHLG